ncbi:MAG TPA: carbohydrate ABC transporter permease [Geminicoccaceae bacterium]|nr:carbohydrate ABC transporter permease [Geminicoccaceae bacterium]
MSRHASRAVILVTASCLVMFVWAFPVLWTLLTSLKPGVDVLAYPPVVIFEPRWRNYWDVLFGPTSILPHLWDSLAVSVLATTITLALAVPAAYGFARLRFWGRRALGFYTLATQMLPRIGLVIPYFLFLNRIGWIDTYRGLVLVYLTFSLPFAIWLMVSYFEDIPREMEEAAFLDRAGRFRTFWYVILPQVRGGIAVTVIFVFLNAWNEFLFAVLLGGKRVQTVTVHMFNYVGIEQTQWAMLSAAGIIAMIPVIVIGLAGQKHIVKGLTIGAVKGGGRR